MLADGQSPAISYDGPSSAAGAFGVGGTVAAQTPATLECTAYGQPVTANGGTSALWDYTTVGWLSDQVVNTGSSGPAAPACTGTVTSPQPDSFAPSKITGPFPVISDGDAIAVDVAPSGDPTGQSVVYGQFVQLVCFVHASYTPPPASLAGAGGNDEWDQIVSPPGWIPDSYVDSHTEGSAAPACP